MHLVKIKFSNFLVFVGVSDINSFQSDESDSGAESDTNSNPPDPSDSSDDDFVANTKKKIPDEVLWKMFKTGASFRSLSRIVELSFALGNQNQYQTSVSYLFQQYKRLSSAKEEEYKARIRAENHFGTICFDHQSMRQMSNKYANLTNRLVVVWYANGSNNVIAVGEMPDKTAASQVQVIQAACNNFNIVREQIVALTCDNAKPNVGHISGTCTILEQVLEKDLLRLMCNHHIAEIVIKDVYHFLFPNKTPNNLFYPILKEKWMDLKEMDFPYAPFDEDAYIENFDGLGQRLFEELKNTALADIVACLGSSNVRDDYKEINILSYRFLGERFNMNKTNQTKFYALINPSNARFMGTAIQGLKSYLFRYYLDWESPEREKIRQNLERFTLFVVLVYIRFWNRSNILFDVAVNTIEFLQNLEKYAQLDFDVANVAKTALCRHLYYMSEELSVLALFSNKISIVEKNEMATRILQQDNINLPPRRAESNHIMYLESIEFGNINLSVPQLTGERSHYLFNIMKIPTSFLNCDASEWNTNRDYLHAKNTISKTLTCINDNSERVVSASKSNIRKQRSKNNDSFRRSMFSTSYD